MLVVCEGQVTEVEYFEGIRDYFRSLPVDIRSCKVIGLGRDPGSLVDYTIRERDKKEKEARAQRDANIAYDEVWCVVDVDDHKTLDQALIAARKAGINLAISLPCFELWVLYHFEECAAACDPESIRRKLRNTSGTMTNIWAARSRSRTMRSRVIAPSALIPIIARPTARDVTRPPMLG
ncbi:RloB family protein [Nonomuraea sp. NPDC049750]|uniref:RloB family protein n=1 Tax=Nonomuraea sp. NPDC049750 TaxID=3154738 RepID=UPI0033FEF286